MEIKRKLYVKELNIVVDKQVIVFLFGRMVYKEFSLNVMFLSAQQSNSRHPPTHQE